MIAWVLENVAHIAWCGDSRAYLFNAGSGLVRLSKDHSYVQELVDAGKLDPELAFDHPNSNIITRSLGDSHVKARPDYVSRMLSKGDYLLLCSDGLCGLCRDEEIAQVMLKAENIETCKNSLIKAALNAGGYDNVTVALLEVDSLGEESEKSIVEDTTNDLSKAKSRKKKNRGLTAFIILLLLVGAVGYLYHTGKWEPALDYIKGKFSTALENADSTMEKVDSASVNLETIDRMSDDTPADTTNI